MKHNLANGLARRTLPQISDGPEVKYELDRFHATSMFLLYISHKKDLTKLYIF
jgi:hypothetical protein